MLTARPIIFSAAMVRALLAGTKSQTRRVVKPTRGRPIEFVGGGPRGGADWNDPSCWGYESGDGEWLLLRPDEGAFQYPCPYGQPGDLLWVRETLREGLTGWVYAVGETDVLVDKARESECAVWAHHKEGPTCSPIHMPRWASRLTLRLTEVRVQRLQEISEADAIAEGVDRFSHTARWPDGDPGSIGDVARRNYSALWDEINGAGSWAANSLVWALTFDTLKQNVDAVRSPEAAKLRVQPMKHQEGGA